MHINAVSGQGWPFCRSPCLHACSVHSQPGLCGMLLEPNPLEPRQQAGKCLLLKTIRLRSLLALLMPEWCAQAEKSRIRPAWEPDRPQPSNGARFKPSPAASSSPPALGETPTDTCSNFSSALLHKCRNLSGVWFAGCKTICLLDVCQKCRVLLMWLSAASCRLQHSVMLALSGGT